MLPFGNILSHMKREATDLCFPKELHATEFLGVDDWKLPRMRKMGKKPHPHYNDKQSVGDTNTCFFDFQVWEHWVTSLNLNHNPPNEHSQDLHAVRKRQLGEGLTWKRRTR